MAHLNRSPKEMGTDLKSDWRLTGQERFLQGAALRLQSFRIRPSRPSWDHEHCEFCGVKIIEEKKKKEGDGCLTSAYATEDEYRWVCPQCFDDFKTKFQWKVVG